jgi:hypothetical protein
MYMDHGTWHMCLSFLSLVDKGKADRYPQQSLSRPAKQPELHKMVSYCSDVSHRLGIRVPSNLMH